jgi:hypothetical protein
MGAFQDLCQRLGLGCRLEDDALARERVEAGRYDRAICAVRPRLDVAAASLSAGSLPHDDVR